MVGNTVQQICVIFANLFRKEKNWSLHSVVRLTVFAYDLYNPATWWKIYTLSLRVHKCICIAFLYIVWSVFNEVPIIWLCFFPCTETNLQCAILDYYYIPRPLGLWYTENKFNWGNLLIKYVAIICRCVHVS